MRALAVILSKETEARERGNCYFALFSDNYNKFESNDTNSHVKFRSADFPTAIDAKIAMMDYIRNNNYIIKYIDKEKAAIILED